MGRPPDPARTAMTRARLLDAAVHAFAEKGFHGTTTRDIATSAGVSSAALYAHHRSKEELLYLISRSGHERTLEIIEEALASSDDPVTKLAAVAHDFAVHHARNHVSARVVNYELAALSPEHREQILTLRQRIGREIRQLVQRGVEAGVFDTTNPHMAAVALLSVGIDVARWYREGGDWSAEDIGAYHADMALRIVGAGPPARLARVVQADDGTVRPRR